MLDSPVSVDVVGWKIEKDVGFSISYCHQYINIQSIPFGPHDCLDKAFKLVWSSGVPIKINIFGWRCLSNTLPTCDLLASRGIIFFPIVGFVFCNKVGEASLHSLLPCYNVALVWKEITSWIGLVNLFTESFKESFLKWFWYCRGRNVKKGKE